MIHTTASKAQALKNGRLLAIALTCFLLLAPSLAADLSAQNRAGPSTRPAYLLPDAALADSLSLSASNRDSFLRTGQVMVLYDDQPSTVLSPNPGRNKAIYQDMKKVGPSLGMELLAAYPMPKKLAQASNRELLIYTQLQQFKSMEGITYWSASRAENRVFYIRSSLVDNPSQRRPLQDPVPKSIEAVKTAWLLQEDSSFGNNLYSMRIQAPEPGYLELDLLNWEQIWYGIAPVLGPQGLICKISISMRGQYLLFYGNTAINAARVFGLDEKARTSYTNRMLALFWWFCGRLEIQESQLP